VHVHAEIENKTGRLIPGMYIKGEILTDSAETYALPEEAITREGDKYLAFLAEKEMEGEKESWINIVIIKNSCFKRGEDSIMIKELEDQLNRRQIRPTAMRLLVLETLQQQAAAVSLQDLEAAFEQADRITLYRTLKTFEEKGLVHSIEDGTGVTKYALCEEGCVCAPEDLHVHFFCNNCQETFCLPKVKVPEIQLPGRFQAQEANLLVKGLCEKCGG
jgi:Fur family ferric uptake transcriptional regulator